jgi:hypothetical protein
MSSGSISHIANYRPHAYHPSVLTDTAPALRIRSLRATRVSAAGLLVRVSRQGRLELPRIAYRDPAARVPLLYRKLSLEGNHTHLEAHCISEAMNPLGSVRPNDQHVFPTRSIDARLNLQCLTRTLEDPQHIPTHRHQIVRCRCADDGRVGRLLRTAAAATAAVIALAAAPLAGAGFSAAVATSAGCSNLRQRRFTTSTEREHCSDDG